MATEAVRVIVRCRPTNQREESLRCKNIIKMHSAVGQVAISKPKEPNHPPKSFTFDGVYDQQSITESIYADICYPLVEGVVEGYNGTVFAYGQTGCGKSFTMQGINDPPTQRGIIPRAFEHIFESVQVTENAKFLIHTSYLEIYNEEIRDLLGRNPKQKLDVKEHPDKGVFVKNLHLLPCYNVSDMEKVMENGTKNRSTGATLMNADSSRSHSIFTIHVEMCETGNDGSEHIRVGKLNLVDLAGSERQAKTGATGDRLKEATKINLSLSALGNVISALVDGKSLHIPYRDSKLTRLLQDSLGGNTKTLMVACISPADNNYDETLSTLRYANRAKNIKNKPKINEDPKDALLREYQAQIEVLKEMLAGQAAINPDMLAKLGIEGLQQQDNKSDTTSNDDKERALSAEIETLREEYEQKFSDMERLFEDEKTSKEKLQRDFEQLELEYKEKVKKIEERFMQNVTNETEENGEVAMESDDDDNNDLIEKEKQENVSNSIQEMKEDDDKIVKGHAGFVARMNIVAEELQVEAQKRLENLQEQLVGGEKRGDLKLAEKRKQRKAYARSKREKMITAIQQMEDDGVMVKVYDNMQDEIRNKTEKLEHLENDLKASEFEIDDLQQEFERDRVDYLETIRKLEQQIKLQNQLVDKIQPCIRRDCNYYYLDRIRQQSKWDEEKQQWTLPPLTVERTILPADINSSGNGLVAHKSPFGQKSSRETQNNEQPEGYFEHSGHDKFLQLLSRNSNEDLASTYFKSKRADKLLASSSSYDQMKGKDKSHPLLASLDINGNERNETNGLQHRNTLPRSLDPIQKKTKLGGQGSGNKKKRNNRTNGFD